MTASPTKNAFNRATVYGATLGGLGVALGAFGAHALKDQLSPDALAIFETGTKYQMYHALALLALGAQPAQKRAPAFLLAGTVVFSGSLYALALSGVKPLGAITPIGGVIQLVGWGLVLADALGARKADKQEHPA